MMGTRWESPAADGRDWIEDVRTPKRSNAVYVQAPKKVFAAPSFRPCALTLPSPPIYFKIGMCVLRVV
jgi:hypothetical protein